MKLKLVSVLLILTGILNAQDDFYILEINQKYYAEIIQNRFDKAIASNHYFKCEEKYCFEVDQEDLELRFGILNRRVVPKRFLKNITYYEVIFCGEEGERILLE